MRYTNAMNYSAEALKRHKELKGKIAIALKDPLDSPEKLSIYYTPGVAAVSSYVAEHPDEARDYTWLNNSVAVISDGTAVLGLGTVIAMGALLPAAGISLAVCLLLAGVVAPWLAARAARATEQRAVAARASIASIALGLLDDPGALAVQGRIAPELAALRQSDADLAEAIDAGAGPAALAAALLASISAASSVESVRLDPELKRDLLLRAAEAHISVSEAIRRAIGQYLRAS